MFGRKKRSNRSRRRTSSVLSTQFFVGTSVFLLVALVGSVIWYGTRLESLSITNVIVEGGETINHEQVRSIVEEELNGEHYRLVPRRFAWTYPKGQILEKVRSLPRVSVVEIDDSSATTLHIYLKEYAPHALWCDTEVKENCVFIDDQGVAFASAPALIGTSLLRYVNGQKPSLDEKPFGPVFLKESGRFAKELSERFSWSVALVEWIGQEDVSYSLRGGGVLKTTLRTPIDETLENLNIIMVSNQFDHLSPGNFTYIDLRFGDKVFVNEGYGIEDRGVVATSSTME